MSVAPYLRSPLPSCSILLDRHTHKNAGSTMRSIYRDNDLQDDWVLWGYNPASMAEVSLSLLHLLLEARRGGNCTLRTPLRLVMEHHYSRTADWDAVVTRFGPHTPLQRVAGGCGCRVVLFTRVREPLDYYVSFYRWTVWWRQRENATTHGWGLFEWAPRNLQSAILLSPMSSGWAEYLGVRTPRGRLKRRGFAQFDEGEPGAAAARARLRSLLDAMDLVGLVERFDETLLLLADLTGLQQLLYSPTVPASTAGTRLPPGVAAPPAADICPDRQACRARIGAVAPVDASVYDDARREFSARVAAYGPSFAERLAQLRAARQAFGARERARRQRRPLARSPYHRWTGARMLRSARLVNLSRLRCQFGRTRPARRLCRQVYADMAFVHNWHLTRAECCDTLRACAGAAAAALPPGCASWQLQGGGGGGGGVGGGGGGGGGGARQVSDADCERLCRPPVDRDRRLIERATGRLFAAPLAGWAPPVPVRSVSSRQGLRDTPAAPADGAWCNDTSDFSMTPVRPWGDFVSCAAEARDGGCLPERARMDHAYVRLHCQRTCHLCSLGTELLIAPAVLPPSRMVAAGGSGAVSHTERAGRRWGAVSD